MAAGKKEKPQNNRRKNTTFDSLRTHSTQKHDNFLSLSGQPPLAWEFRSTPGLEFTLSTFLLGFLSLVRTTVWAGRRFWGEKMFRPSSFDSFGGSGGVVVLQLYIKTKSIRLHYNF